MFVVQNKEYEIEENKKQMIIDLMIIIMEHEGDIIKTNAMNNSALSLAYKIKDKKYYNLLLNCFKSIELLSDEFGRNFLRQIVIDKADVLSNTLDKCLIKDCHTEFLLDLGLMALKQKSNDIYKNILDHCKTKDIILKNGETFLTNLVKNKEDISIITDIVTSKYFDINKVNLRNESILMIACEQLNENIVKFLVRSGCDVTYNSYGAVQATINAKLKNPDLQNIDQISNNIMNFLWKPQVTDSQQRSLKSSQIERVVRIPNDIGKFNNQYYQDYYGQPQAYHPHKEQFVLDLLKMLIDSKGNLILENAQKVNFLSKSYDYQDKSYFSQLLKRCPGNLQILSNESGIKLLFKLSSEAKLNALEFILSKIEIAGNSNENLLKLAVRVLKNGGIETYNKIIKMCIDPNAIFDDGETFISSLFKNNVKESIIKFVIESGLFDAKKTNNKAENALMLACSRLMTTVIPILLNQGCEIAYSGYNAVIMTIVGNQTLKSEESKLKMNEILSLFFDHASKKNPVEVIGKNKIGNSKKSQISTYLQLAISKYQLKIKTRILENSSKLNFVESVIVALFAKSDNLDFLISQVNPQPQYEAIRKVLAWKIIYPLREFGYVSHHMLEDLAKCFGEINLFELDEISTFISTFSNGEFFLSLISYERKKSMSIQLKLFIDLKERLDYITSEQLLNISMIQNKILFEKIPSCLIIQAAKDSKSAFSYRNLIPLKSIEISKLIINKFKKCLHCDSVAFFQCHICITIGALEISSGFFCQKHMCKHPEAVKLPEFNLWNKSKIFLNLSSIIYKTKLYYGALVKQKGSENIWSSYKVNEKDGMTFANLSYDKEISYFLQLNEDEMKQHISYHDMEFLQLVMKNIHFLIYDNNALNCY